MIMQSTFVLVLPSKLHLIGNRLSVIVHLLRIYITANGQVWNHERKHKHLQYIEEKSQEQT